MAVPPRACDTQRARAWCDVIHRRSSVREARRGTSRVHECSAVPVPPVANSRRHTARARRRGRESAFAPSAQEGAEGQRADLDKIPQLLHTHVRLGVASCSFAALVVGRRSAERVISPHPDHGQTHTCNEFRRSESLAVCFFLHGPSHVCGLRSRPSVAAAWRSCRNDRRGRGHSSSIRTSHPSG